MGWIKRSPLNSNYEHFDKTAADIRETLRIFADVASGERQKSEGDVNALEVKLLTAVESVQDLSRRVGGGDSFVKSYEAAAVKLRNAAEAINGPLTGKGMVVAVNDYLLAEQAVREAVVTETNAFFW